MPWGALGALLVRLPGEDNERRGNVILGKLEGNNPAGSVKDRPAISMIRRAEERGEIKPGDTLIEATSGNTGIALAMVCAAKGYQFVSFMVESSTLAFSGIGRHSTSSLPMCCTGAAFSVSAKYTASRRRATVGFASATAVTGPLPRPDRSGTSSRLLNGSCQVHTVDPWSAEADTGSP